MSAVKRILEEVVGLSDISESAKLVDDGYLDSFDLISLVAALEVEYNLQISGDDLIAENFNSINAIERLIRGYEG